MKEYKITFHATVYKTAAVEVSGNTEEEALDEFNNNGKYYLNMSDLVRNSCGERMEDIDIDIQNIECIYEEDEDDDLSSN